MATMQVYDLAILIRGSLDEAAQKKVLSQLGDTAKKLGGEAKFVESWEKKVLSYDIKKEREGYYHFFALSLPPGGVKEIDAKIRLNDAILRHLISFPKRKKGKGKKE